ncbi:MAG: NUDIX domain-containing protein [Propioniciclava sp.]|uniref:NUDIX hydrolase n=1 Tax=Propioniciclava sp. TaxID=2038686 RepID=UPI0039E6CAFB
MTSEPFRTRTFAAVPAHLRPHKTRRGVRVVVTDGASVLLFHDTDPGVPGSRWWITPGGGMDPGETEAQTAVRELAEETGLIAEESALIGPVMRRVVLHGYSDQVCEQTESFYVLRAERFEVDISGHTADEQQTIAGHAWLPLDELDRQSEPVWPAGLAALVASAPDPQSWPGDIGLVEESTVPVSPPRPLP